MILAQKFPGMKCVLGSTGRNCSHHSHQVATALGLIPAGFSFASKLVSGQWNQMPKLTVYRNK